MLDVGFGDRRGGGGQLGGVVEQTQGGLVQLSGSVAGLNSFDQLVVLDLSTEVPCVGLRSVVTVVGS